MKIAQEEVLHYSISYILIAGQKVDLTIWVDFRSRSNHLQVQHPRRAD